MERERTHECHWPHCGERVPRSLWGCRKHWYMLPARIRDQINWAWRHGTLAEYDAALEEAQQWIEGTDIGAPYRGSQGR